MRFFEKIRSIKNKEGLTTQELSQKSGIPLGTLNKLLSGVIEEPKLSVALALCRALGVSLGALLEEDAVSLSQDEQKLLKDYRNSDGYGKAAVRAVAEMESGRTADALGAENEKNQSLAADSKSAAMITIPLYILPVSAGTGTFLDHADRESIDVRADAATEKADFALRVSGNSMEPRFRHGDIVLVHQQPSVNFGELGIFIANGEGYFKRYMGDRLHSLNPEYPDIPLCRFDDFLCCGKVVGHLRKKIAS